MAAINNPELSVTTNRPQDRATVVVSCDVEFTDVEVNAMNMLGLQYTLSCQVLNKELLDEDPVVTYHERTFPVLLSMRSATTTWFSTRTRPCISCTSVCSVRTSLSRSSS